MPDAIDARARLRADCSGCAGLCCVAPAFAASADFAIDKPAGQACPHLQRDSRCEIHADLRERGFPGCTVFDCFGAGQQTVQVTFAGGGRDWHADPEVFAAFGVQRLLHELLWYLTEALTLPAAAPLRRELTAARDGVERLTGAGAAELAAADTALLQGEVGALLLSVSELARSGVRPRAGGRRRADRRNADLVGADLRRADLPGRPSAGARRERASGGGRRVLQLHRTDVLGADVRGADVRGADLSGALFLTRRQVAGARGDAATALPAGFEHPAHWGPR